MSVDKNEILKFFAHYIEKELGIVYAEHNYFQLQSRLEDMARFQNLPGIEEVYKDALKGLDHKFQQYLLDLATNNETSFFRDLKVFRAVQEVFEKRIHQLKK